MNVYELENIAVENTQSLKRSSIPPKATEEVIGLDKGKSSGIKRIFQEETFKYNKETINNNHGFTNSPYNGIYDRDSKHLT